MLPPPRPEHIHFPASHMEKAGLVHLCLGKGHVETLSLHPQDAMAFRDCCVLGVSENDPEPSGQASGQPWAGTSRFRLPLRHLFLLRVPSVTCLGLALKELLRKKPMEPNRAPAENSHPRFHGHLYPETMGGPPTQTPALGWTAFHLPGRSPPGSTRQLLPGYQPFSVVQALVLFISVK